METRNKIFWTVGIVLGIVAIIFAQISYDQTPTKYSAWPREITEIPLNAEKVENAKATNILYNNITYGADIDFLPDKVKDASVFGKIQFDRILFSVHTKLYGTAEQKERIVIYIRGIKHDQLPLVYDYQQEINLWPEGKINPIWFNVNNFKWELSKGVPWIISVEVSKIGFTSSLLISLLVALIVGVLSSYTLKLAYPLIMSKESKRKN